MRTKINENKYKVGIIGASGKVGRQTIQNLLLYSPCENLELVLIARNKERISGALADIRSTSLISHGLNQINHPEPTIVISNNMKDLVGCKLVVLLVGVWPSPKQKERFKKIDYSGRLVQSYINLPVVQNITVQIKKYASSAYVIVGTNQSDMMAEVVRSILLPKKVLGFGGMVDSMRFRTLMKSKNEKNSYGLKGNHMIGYHNNEMVPLLSSVSRALAKYETEQVVDEVRAYGSNVSKLQKNFNFPNMNTGPSVLPGIAMSTIISAFAGKLDLEESFNIVLNEKTAKFYGVQPNKALSVPIKISKGGYNVVTEYKISISEKNYLKQAQKNFYSSYNSLFQKCKIIEEFKDLENNCI